MRKYLTVLALALFQLDDCEAEQTFQGKEVEIVAVAGRYEGVKEVVGGIGSRKLSLEIYDLKNDINWASGVTVSFSKDDYRNSFTFQLFQVDERDTFLTAGIRCVINGNDILNSDLHEFPLNEYVNLEFSWDANGVLTYAFGNHEPKTFHTNFKANQLIYSVSSGTGRIIKQ